MKIKVSTHDYDTKEFELELNGTTLEVSFGETKKGTDLASLIPQFEAERYLGDGHFDEQSRELVLITKASGQEDKEVRIPMLAFFNLLETIKGEKGDDGLPGANGKSAYELAVENGFTGSETEWLASLQGTSASGDAFDPSTIPEKPFENGSKVVAFDSNGQLYKFTQGATYFKDVAVSLSQVDGPASVPEGTKYRVSATVTNNTPDNVDTTLTIYTDSSLSNVEKDNIVSQEDNTFTVAGLASYETTTVTFDVIITTNTYVSATVSTVGDRLTNNDAAQVSLSAVAKSTSLGNSFSEECPEIIATFNGTALLASEQVSDNKATRLDYNIIDNASLAGLTVNLSGASSVVLKSDDTSYNGFSWRKSIVKSVGENAFHAHYVVDVDHREELGKEKYTFNPTTGDLTFAEDYPYPYVTIFARPASANCKWQVFHLWAKANNVTWSLSQNPIVVTGLESSHYSYEQGKAQLEGEDIPLLENGANAVTNGESMQVLSLDGSVQNLSEYTFFPYPIESSFVSRAYTQWDGGYDIVNNWSESVKTIVYSSFLAISLKQGTAYEFTLSNLPKGALPETQGNVAISWTGSEYQVVVSANASATDNVYREKLRITIA